MFIIFYVLLAIALGSLGHPGLCLLFLLLAGARLLPFLEILGFLGGAYSKPIRSYSAKARSIHTP